VKDLLPGTKGHCLVVQVNSIEPVIEKARLDGSVSRVAEALVGDETGAVILFAKNGMLSQCRLFGHSLIMIDQIGLLKVGRPIVIRNANADVFNGFLRLNVTQWGKISVHPDGIASTPDVPASVLTSNNMSTVEYELVPMDEGDEADD
jgi:ssDNA-binding replication factor A large subunit